MKGEINMSLRNKLKESVSGDKFGTENPSVSIRTGFDVFDYTNSTTEIINGAEYVTKGIGAGKNVMIIGRSGSGKSTLALQMAHNIIEQYDESSLIIFDFEKAYKPARYKMVNGVDDDYLEEKVELKNNNITANSVMRTIAGIHKFKMEHKKEYLIPNKEGQVDPKTGEIIKIFPPTVLIIDSIPDMKAELGGADAEELAGNMDGARMAKIIGSLFKTSLHPCAEANIICIYINHINDVVNTGVMPKAAAINYLKQDESIPGGKTAQFNTDIMLRVTPGTKHEVDKSPYKIKGFEATVSIVKSRSSEAGRSVKLIYSQVEGFDNDLSSLEFLKSFKDEGYIQGSPRGGYYIDGLPDEKFKYYTFKDKLRDSETFRSHFNATLSIALDTLTTTSSKCEIPPQELEFDEVIDENGEILEVEVDTQIEE